MASSSGGMTSTAAALVGIDELMQKVSSIGQDLARHFELVREAKDIIDAQLVHLMQEGDQLQGQLDRTAGQLSELRLLVETPPPPPPPPTPAAPPPGLRMPPPPPTALARMAPPSGSRPATAIAPPRPGINKENYHTMLNFPDNTNVSGPDPWTQQVPQEVDALFAQAAVYMGSDQACNPSGYAVHLVTPRRGAGWGSRGWGKTCGVCPGAKDMHGGGHQTSDTHMSRMIAVYDELGHAASDREVIAYLESHHYWYPADCWSRIM